MRKRKDKLKNKAKVIKEIITNPLSTVREVAEKTGVGSSTVQRNIKEMAQNGTKDDRILGICDEDLKIIIEGQKVVLDKIKNAGNIAKINEIVSALNDSTKRYSLFIGKATDEKGGLNNISSVIIE